MWDIKQAKSGVKNWRFLDLLALPPPALWVLSDYIKHEGVGLSQSPVPVLWQPPMAQRTGRAVTSPLQVLCFPALPFPRWGTATVPL